MAVVVFLSAIPTRGYAFHRRDPWINFTPTRMYGLQPIRIGEPRNGIPAIDGPLRALFLLLLLVLLFGWTGIIATQNGHPTQDDVEAVYLYNFGRFVEWPLTLSRKALYICVLGQDPFDGTLDRIVSKQRVNGLSLIVVGMKATHAIGSYAILFFGASEASRLDRSLSALNGLPVLTVSDLSGFIDHGGMIQFVMENDSVRFEVNLTAADKAGLIVSSQLLKVATHIFGKLSEGATR